jgi:excisionase family DNA binding protein
MELEDKWVNTAELEKYLSLTKPTIMKLVRNGKIPKPIKVGSQRLLWYKPDVKEAMFKFPAL